MNRLEEAIYRGEREKVRGVAKTMKQLQAAHKRALAREIKFRRDAAPGATEDTFR